MQHRHLNHEMFTLAAIDDIIARGKRPDWVALRRAALADPDLMQKVLRVCRANCDDPYARRYHFWKHYAEIHLA
jgi:2,4-dienoyl-CoA reductase-like NADH-dependent reductase (Old Yellow Enzyme family)